MIKFIREAHSVGVMLCDVMPLIIIIIIIIITKATIIIIIIIIIMMFTIIIGVIIDANEFHAKFVIADSVLDTCELGFAGLMVTLFSQ